MRLLREPGLPVPPSPIHWECLSAPIREEPGKSKHPPACQRDRRAATASIWRSIRLRLATASTILSISERSRRLSRPTRGKVFRRFPFPMPTRTLGPLFRNPTPSVVYCGNDGSIDVSTDSGTTWKSLGGGGLQTALFFNVDVKPDATG